MEDIVIKLHDIAREVIDDEISKSIRKLADDISDKIKVEKKYGEYS